MLQKNEMRKKIFIILIVLYIVSIIVMNIHTNFLTITFAVFFTVSFLSYVLWWNIDEMTKMKKLMKVAIDLHKPVKWLKETNV